MVSHRKQPRKVAVFGSTGSVGVSALDVIASQPAGTLEVETLTGGSNTALLAEQALIFRPKRVVIADEAGYADLKRRLAGAGIEVVAGRAALIDAAREKVDIHIAAIVGAAGLEPTLAAAGTGADIALANKECLVCAGTLFTEAVERGGGALLPVDSEHNAIFQVLDGRNNEVERLFLTASGGPFRNYSREAMRRITPEEAARHPNWSMGQRISIDSASMFNKGLEVIEAHVLFDVGPQRIEVLVHPQSIVHSMVSFEDGSVLAQMGMPDMRTPIAHALGWPRRLRTDVERLDLTRLGRLEFAAPDMTRFPALRLAFEVLEAGGAAGCVYNAAKEVAQEAFIDKRIGFLDMASVVEEVLVNADFSAQAQSLTAILDLDRMARVRAREVTECMLK